MDLDGCCGIGGISRGLADAGHEVTGVDINPRLRDDYLRSGAAEFICADILEVLADTSFMSRFDAATVSPPCFPAGTPVTTARGVLPIESVRTDDLVLTHQGRWRPVTATMSRKADVYADGWLASTADHPFWARRQVWAKTTGRQGAGGGHKGTDQDTPCEICGQPTTSVYGVCSRTTRCRNESSYRTKRRSRQEPERDRLPGGHRGTDYDIPCEVCGQPTSSKYGVCQKTAPCRRELSSRANQWSFSEPSWTPAGKLHGQFVAIPAAAESLSIPPVPDRQTSRGDPITPGAPFWWMVGRWVGDGWLRIMNPSSASPSRAARTSSRIPSLCVQCGEPTPRSKRHPSMWNNYCTAACRVKMSRRRRPAARYAVTICCAAEEADGLESKLADTGLRWTRSRGRTTTKFIASHKGLAQWLAANFGQGAVNKTIPGWLFGADTETRQAFLDGYISADGHDTPGGHAITTVSTGLAFGIRQLVTTLGYSSSVSLNTPPKTIVIEGRTVNQRPWWHVSITQNDTWTRPDGLHRWVKRRRPMTLRGRETVYDLTIDEDHSFIAWGFAVHNCQSASRMSSCRPGLAETYRNLIPDIRPLLMKWGGPFTIENVSGMRPWMISPLTLCMYAHFGREHYRHRLIEAGGGLVLTPPEPPDGPAYACNDSQNGRGRAVRVNKECGMPHPVRTARAGHWEPGMFVSVAGHERKEPVRRVMEIDWARNRDDIKEAVPPYVGAWLAEQFEAHLAAIAA